MPTELERIAETAKEAQQSAAACMLRVERQDTKLILIEEKNSETLVGIRNDMKEYREGNSVEHKTLHARITRAIVAGLLAAISALAAALTFVLTNGSPWSS